MRRVGFLLGLIAVALVGRSNQVPLERQQLFPGYDGRFCKVQPAVESDGGDVAILTYQRLLLTGSDVFYGQFISRSGDGGRTWSEPKEIGLFADTREGDFRVARYANPHFNRKHRYWFALGVAQLFKNDREPHQVAVDGKPYCRPILVTVDAVKGEFTACRDLDFPFAYEHAMPFGQIVELEDGEMLIPFYFRPCGAGHRGRCVVVCYRLESGRLVVVKAGEPIVAEGLKRGVCEPSIVRYGGRFFMTLRSDEYGMFATSDDGLRWSKPIKWCWDDGTPIGNANTQQHWIPSGDELYLAYTRVRADNQHVFRNRAPILMARFDAGRGCLVRSTEREMVPNRGARLGNFAVTDNPADETWLVTAEWMQSDPKVCERYGSDNSIWLVRVKRSLSEVPSKPGRGLLCLTFDDRNFAAWLRELPRFRKYGAHATFFVCGPIDEFAAGAMRKLAEDGHSLGLHGQRHLRAVGEAKRTGIDGWLKTEVEPQVKASRQFGLKIGSWGYPCSERNTDTDFALGRHFRHLRCGHCWRRGAEVGSRPLASVDAAFAPAQGFGRELVAYGIAIPSTSELMESDVGGALERVASRDEALVLYAHNIRNDGKSDPHDISPEQLEFILSRAHALGIHIVGFDELDYGCVSYD